MSFLDTLDARDHLAFSPQAAPLPIGLHFSGAQRALLLSAPRSKSQSAAKQPGNRIRRRPHVSSVLKPLWLILLLLLTVQLGSAQDKVVIGSKTFAESRVLAELMAQMLEAHSKLDVERQYGLNGTMVCFEAIDSGQLDVYPEYTGTGVITILKRTGDFRDPLQTYLVAQRGFLKEYSLVWLSPFGFNNTYVMAVREPYALEHGLEKVSDLAKVQNEIRPGVSHEFLSRPDGFPGLSKAYGIDFPKASGIEHGLAYQAIANGKIDLIDGFSTDGELLRYKLKGLVDDKQFFPPYQAAPVVRQDLLDAHPEVADILNRLAFQVDEATMQRLNYQVQEEKIPIPEVVSSFLLDKGLIDEAQVVEGDGELKSQSFLQFMMGRWSKTLELTRQHIFLAMTSLLLAIAFGVPVGILITRYAPLSQPVLGLAGVIQTIPSIALLAFMIPVPGFGLGARSAIAALFLYALLPIIRNTYTGIQEVDQGLLEAARGMGLSDRQLLTIVELPLATNTIMAGVRTSAVINVGVATLAAFIGAGGLGDPIVTGLQLNDTPLILAGAIPAALLAIVVDQLLGLVEKVLSPKGLKS